MKKYICFAAMLLLVSGCAVSDWTGIGKSDKSKQDSAMRQLEAGKASFNKKLENTRGKSLAQLKKEWGGLDGGLMRDNLSVFQWRQTARLTQPEGVDKKSSSGGTTMASCLAMFIVQEGVVVDATSEGQCFDYSRMAAWQPYITQSSDGRTGEVTKR